MREIFNDFMRVQRRPDGSVRIPLGAEQVTPDLAGLRNGDRVLIVDPGELQAEATVESELQNGWTVWYAVVASEAEIREIPTGAPTGHAAAS